mgnify:CR=1 FL=1
MLHLAHDGGGISAADTETAKKQRAALAQLLEQLLNGPHEVDGLQQNTTGTRLFPKSISTPQKARGAAREASAKCRNPLSKRDAFDRGRFPGELMALTLSSLVRTSATDDYNLSSKARMSPVERRASGKGLGC